MQQNYGNPNQIKMRMYHKACILYRSKLKLKVWLFVELLRKVRMSSRSISIVSSRSYSSKCIQATTMLNIDIQHIFYIGT